MARSLRVCLRLSFRLWLFFSVSLSLPLSVSFSLLVSVCRFLSLSLCFSLYLSLSQLPAQAEGRLRRGHNVERQHHLAPASALSPPPPRALSSQSYLGCRPIG